jgi:hypothetical protein
LTGVANILNGIDNENNINNLPANYRAFATFGALIEALPNDNTLPHGYRKDDIVNIYNNYRQRLLDNKFIADFQDAGNDAEAKAITAVTRARLIGDYT